MYDVHSGIKMSNHVEQGSTYSNCFSGGLPRHLNNIIIYLYIYIIHKNVISLFI